MNYKYENCSFERYIFPERKENETQERYLEQSGFEIAPVICWGNEETYFEMKVFEGGENELQYYADMRIGNQHKCVYISAFPSLLEFLRCIEPIRHMAAEDEARINQLFECER